MFAPRSLVPFTHNDHLSAEGVADGGSGEGVGAITSAVFGRGCVSVDENGGCVGVTAAGAFGSDCTPAGESGAVGAIFCMGWRIQDSPIKLTMNTIKNHMAHLRREVFIIFFLTPTRFSFQPQSCSSPSGLTCRLYNTSIHGRLQESNTGDVLPTFPWPMCVNYYALQCLYLNYPLKRQPIWSSRI